MYRILLEFSPSVKISVASFVFLLLMLVPIFMKLRPISAVSVSSYDFDISVLMSLASSFPMTLEFMIEILISRTIFLPRLFQRVSILISLILPSLVFLWSDLNDLALYVVVILLSSFRVCFAVTYTHCQLLPKLNSLLNLRICQASWLCLTTSTGFSFVEVFFEDSTALALRITMLCFFISGLLLLANVTYYWLHVVIISLPNENLTRQLYEGSISLSSLWILLVGQFILQVVHFGRPSYDSTHVVISVVLYTAFFLLVTVGQLFVNQRNVQYIEVSGGLLRKYSFFLPFSTTPAYT